MHVLLRLASRAAPARLLLRPLSSSARDPAAKGYSGRVVVACSAATAFGALALVRRGWPGDGPEALPSGSRARLPAVVPQVPRVVQVLYRDADGTPHVARLDENTFSAEARRLVGALDAARREVEPNRARAQLVYVRLCLCYAWMAM